ncbi:MAG: hypothetical protein JO080_14045 [Mucilaginibacter sp.]|nr:hypothetical protein [Mucilaginibacter sp.]
MKKIIIILFVACLNAALFSSCSKDGLAPVPQQSKGSSTISPAKNNISPVIPPDPIVGNVNTAITLSGQWKLVKDSTGYSGGQGASGSAYKGIAADYFEFTNDGKLYIQENGSADSATYTINTDKSITVNYLVYNGIPVTSYGAVITNFHQVNLTSVSVTLTSSVASPQGIAYRTIDLKR